MPRSGHDKNKRRQTKYEEALRGESFRSGGDGGSLAIGAWPGLADRRRRRGKRGDRAAAAQAAQARRSKACSANPRNPRRNFTEAELEELADSIKERGIIQPIVVRQLPATHDGLRNHRRRAALARGAAAGLHEVPIAIVEATDAQSLEFAIIENVQRADLNPIEEAAGYRRADGAVQSHAG